jgi:hypothetical protein
MITVASVDYCEQCKCRTLHIPLPSGERACEHHPPGASSPPAPAPFDPLTNYAPPASLRARALPPDSDMWSDPAPALEGERSRR